MVPITVHVCVWKQAYDLSLTLVNHGKKLRCARGEARMQGGEGKAPPTTTMDGRAQQDHEPRDYPIHSPSTGTSSLSTTVD